jgi:hypothetical protein
MSLPNVVRRSCQWLLALPLLASCSADGGSDGVDAGSSTGADAEVAGCSREPGPANGIRKLVVSRPYGDGGANSSRWEILELDSDGSISSTDHFFEMRRATSGIIAFTPDGEIGLVPQDDGSVGVFRLTADGAEVIEEGLSGDFYASGLVMDPDGQHAYILDGNWRENGGGIYRLRIECDGNVRDEGLVAAGKLPSSLTWLSDGRAVVTGRDLGSSPQNQDAHLLPGSALSEPMASTTVFPDRNAIIASAATSADEHYLLVGDNSSFSGVPNRIAVARIDDAALGTVQLLSPIEDPYAIVTSPHDDAALVSSGFGDALVQLSYDPDSSDAPFAVVGELSYQGDGPALPGNMVMVERGDLAGLVLVAENQGVRRVRFDGGGVVRDLGRTEIGSSYNAIVGAIGVQP